MLGCNGTKPSPNDSPQLYLVEFSNTTGEVVVRQRVTNPFIDVEAVSVSLGG